MLVYQRLLPLKIQVSNPPGVADGPEVRGAHTFRCSRHPLLPQLSWARSSPSPICGDPIGKHQWTHKRLVILHGWPSWPCMLCDCEPFPQRGFLSNGFQERTEGWLDLASKQSWVCTVYKNSLNWLYWLIDMDSPQLMEITANEPLTIPTVVGKKHMNSYSTSMNQYESIEIWPRLSSHFKNIAAKIPSEMVENNNNNNNNRTVRRENGTSLDANMGMTNPWE